MNHSSGPEEQFTPFDVALGKPLVLPATGLELTTTDLTIPVEGQDEVPVSPMWVPQLKPGRLIGASFNR